MKLRIIGTMRTTIVIMSLIGMSFAETQLSGDIGGKTFEPAGNPYIISDNISIGEGTLTTLKAGCVFLFKPFSGIVVDGGLIVQGTLDRPVVFTSVNDSIYAGHAEQLPNPFDWNGILVSNKASRVSLSNFILAYSVFGIKSQKEAFTLENGTFKANGQFHVTVDDAVKPVVDGIPYTYKADSSPSGTGGGGTSRPFVKKGLPILIGCAGLAAGAVSVVCGVKLGKTQDSYGTERDSAVLADLEQQWQTELAVCIASGGVAAIAIPVAVALLVRNSRDSGGEQKVSVTPMVGKRLVGLAVTAAF